MIKHSGRLPGKQIRSSEIIYGIVDPELICSALFRTFHCLSASTAFSIRVTHFNRFSPPDALAGHIDRVAGPS